MLVRSIHVLSRSLALGTCALVLLAGGLPAQKGAKPSQKEISRELKQLHDDDQKDQNDPTWNEATDRVFSQRQKVRRDRVMEIIEAGMLADTADWGHAALLLQHGQSADDFLLAHVLSLPPAIADEPFCKFLCAATLDRFLQTVERAQIFTTQSGAADPGVYAPVEPFDDSMSQGLRDLFGLPPLPGREPREKDQKAKSKGPRAKDLPKLLEQARAEPLGSAGGGAPIPEWLTRTREIVRGDSLKSDKDFDLAARILLLGQEHEDLLSAHVLALCAAFRSKSPAARVLCAETLDRYLLAIGRAQRFDTVREQGKPKEPRAPVPGFVLPAYGLGAAPGAK